MNVHMNFSALNVTRSPHTTFIFLIDTLHTKFFSSLLDYDFLICDAV